MARGVDAAKNYGGWKFRTIRPSTAIRFVAALLHGPMATSQDDTVRLLGGAVDRNQVLDPIPRTDTRPHQIQNPVAKQHPKEIVFLNLLL